MPFLKPRVRSLALALPPWPWREAPSGHHDLKPGIPSPISFGFTEDAFPIPKDMVYVVNMYYFLVYMHGAVTPAGHETLIQNQIKCSSISALQGWGRVWQRLACLHSQRGETVLSLGQGSMGLGGSAHHKRPGSSSTQLPIRVLLAWHQPPGCRHTRSTAARWEAASSLPLHWQPEAASKAGELVRGLPSIQKFFHLLSRSLH